jgi:hypothetical protein
MSSTPGSVGLGQYRRRLRAEGSAALALESEGDTYGSLRFD